MTKNDLKYEAVTSRVFIVWHKHGQEPIRLHELSYVFKNIPLTLTDIDYN